MMEFQRLTPELRQTLQQLLEEGDPRGCEYSPVNVILWGRQRVAHMGSHMVIFSQFGRKSVYLYPLGTQPVGQVLEAIIEDARQRGILCRITGMTAEDCMQVEELYPGKFRFYPDRDGSDYIYAIDDLATLAGRKYQKKRNHINRFRSEHPDARLLPMTAALLPQVKVLVDRWFQQRQALEPEGDFHLEQKALSRAFRHFDCLGLEGMVLEEKGTILAMAMGSRFREDTFDIHFEKALEDVDGAYPTINQGFAQYLKKQYPEILWLNREDDMGLEGLRKAKLSYYPHHLGAKFWARLWEDEDED